MSSIKRFVIVTQDYYPLIGGITTWCHEVGLGLRRRGFEVVFITKGFDGQERERRPDVIRLDDRRWRNRRNFVVAKALAPYRTSDTVLLCANWKMAVPCLWGALRGRGTYFTAVHGLDALERRSINRRIQRLALRSGAGVIPVSGYTQSLLEPLRIPREKMRVINNGVDAQRFTPGPSDANIIKKYGLHDGFRILNFGRLTRRKGFDTTIRALAQLNDPAMHLYIGGKGRHGEELQRLASELGVADNVHFLGYIPDEELCALYNSVDVFCMPSRALPLDVEGFGITYLEAAACALPSIGGSGSGAEDAIEHGVTGTLINPESSEELAREIMRLEQNPEIRKELGRNARARVEDKFTWDYIVDRIIEFVYERMGQSYGAQRSE